MCLRVPARPSCAVLGLRRMADLRRSVETVGGQEGGGAKSRPGCALFLRSA